MPPTIDLAVSIDIVFIFNKYPPNVNETGVSGAVNGYTVSPDFKGVMFPLR